jgi:hypothetical protein
MALCVKAVVPSGLMVFANTKTITVGFCTDGIGVPQTKTITVPMEPASPGDPQHKSKADSPCAFSALSAGAIAGADIALLALALAFILLLGTTCVLQMVLRSGVRWHPPLRGPPSRV